VKGRSQHKKNTSTEGLGEKVSGNKGGFSRSPNVRKKTKRCMWSLRNMSREHRKKKEGKNLICLKKKLEEKEV